MHCDGLVPYRNVDCEALNGSVISVDCGLGRGEAVGDHLDLRVCHRLVAVVLVSPNEHPKYSQYSKHCGLVDREAGGKEAHGD